MPPMPDTTVLVVQKGDVGLPYEIKMAITATCPKCGEEMKFGADDDHASKVICRSCDFVRTHKELPFAKTIQEILASINP